MGRRLDVLIARDQAEVAGVAGIEAAGCTGLEGGAGKFTPDLSRDLLVRGRGDPGEALVDTEAQG